jgi:tRNA nucleotidyltransferase (CCA-adding enzyme)
VRSSRSRRSPSSKAVEEYVDSLGLDAYVVGGAVRDELLGHESKDADFLVPGMDIEGLRAALAPHGRTEELVVAGRPVGVRFYPRDRDVRKRARAGIELAPPRREVSTGPGRHDFDIVVDPTATVDDDLRRRDFTVNAMARRLADGTLVDPFDGRRDLERRVLRTVTPHSFAEDPLRIVRGLRFVSQLDLDPDEQTIAQMRSEAPGIRHVSAERIGGGVAADGMGELSKLLMGRHPAKALRLARDTGVLVELLPEFEHAIGFDQRSRYHDLTVDEHTFEVVQAAADAGGAPLRVRLAALLHDLGKPHVAWKGSDGRLHYYAKPGFATHSHEQVSAQLADAALARLRYPTDLRRQVVRIVRGHMLDLGRADDVRARRLLQRYGTELTIDLLDHKRADLLGKGVVNDRELERLAEFREIVEQERTSPHRLRDLAVGGDDLLGIGYAPGPALGRALQTLLDAVVRDPRLNTREQLLARAEELR